MSKGSEGTSRNHLPRQKAIANGRSRVDKAASSRRTIESDWLLSVHLTNHDIHSILCLQGL